MARQRKDSVNNNQALAGISKIIGILDNLDARVRGAVVDHLKSGDEPFFNGHEVFFDLLEDEPGDLDRRKEAVKRVREVVASLDSESGARAAGYLKVLAAAVETPPTPKPARRGGEFDDWLPGREKLVAGAIAYLRTELPELVDVLPPEAQPFSRGFGQGDGLATHPNLVSTSWLTFRGGQAFLCDQSVPDGFMAVGVKNAGDSENAFAMWRKGGRRFWFQDRYVDLMVRGGCRIKQVRNRFLETLRRWETTSGDVAQSGDTDFTLDDRQPS